MTDDEFDGDFGEDDEELPMIHLLLTINPTDAPPARAPAKVVEEKKQLKVPTQTDNSPRASHL